MSSIEVGEKIVLRDGREGIISHVSPEIEHVFEYMTGSIYPIGVSEYRVVEIILTDGSVTRTKIRFGVEYRVEYTDRVLV